jgi:MFS family permease
MGLNIVIPSIGGFLTLISWRLTFFSFIIAIPILLGVIFILPETNPRLTHLSSDKEKTESSTPIEPIPIFTLPKGLIYALFGSMLLGFCYFASNFGAINLFTSFYIENSIGLNAAVTGVFQTIQSIIAWVLTLFMGRIMTRLSKPILSVLAFLSLAGGCFFYTLPPALFWLFPIGGFIGLSWGISFTTLNALVLDLAPPLKRGIITSLFQAIIKLAQTIAPILIGFSFAWAGNQIAAPFIIGMGISLFAAVISLPLVQFSKRTGLGAPQPK